MSAERERRKLSHRLQPIFDGIYLLKDDEGIQISETFQRLPLRTGTDYYKIILNPVSLHGVGRSIKNSTYKSAQEFVSQLAQISWNARLYNMKGSKIYQHAMILNEYILDKVIPKLNAEKSVEVFYPDLGPLPEDDDYPMEGVGKLSTPMKSDDEEEDEDDDYDDYSAINTPPQRSNRNHMVSRTSSYGGVGNKKLESGIRRGRPPIIDRPYETRIKLILKHFKKLRHPNDPNHPLTTHLEKLPDPRMEPNYYSMIKNPICLNDIRAKVRTRKYHNVDEFLADLSLMFQNVKFYYTSNQLSPVYQDCLLLEAEANNIINAELMRPEKDLLVSNTPGGDGIIRVPLDSIDINGQTYKIGDWVLMNNPTEPLKPTVGQIFRLWSTEDGTKYTNVCWYYRPEQTCHRHDRLFFENEVCKTGQYRDHLASEILGPCYVIFLTRHQKGDLPASVVPEGMPWFICEFRYNENSHVFNRIRTWKACLPDEIRDQPEIPLIPLNEPRKLIKFESPIKNTLPSDATPNMAIPEPTPGPDANAPPIMGSVFLREPVEDDELGQYSTSPNVAEAPEYDVDGRKAYLFTPVSQMKMTGGAYPTQSNSGISTPVPVSHDYNDMDRSYSSSVSRYNQNIQQQSHMLQTQQRTVHRIGTGDVRRPAVATTSAFPGPSQSTLSVHNASPAYSNLLSGGVLSYAMNDEDNSLASVAGSVNTKKRKVAPGEFGDAEAEETRDIVWYRSPPLMVGQRIITANGVNLGHSAQYLAWKAQKTNVETKI
ncbi:hypothetical protein PGUG_01177 [Meyerozyma guilliermondii ATCC 6260]|uniref:Uncharacterized protein n=1 Tax=Meyerozyma guilliermondii (strain ATCC 6260 / CBS 566 / DSM 6381 / JCM 1539 / NBRC 10279 / NRRL Y-324) TaxID=294746 RepID=A5DD22_PICGU|nr:uncharacterized protein PGUG_01177 [Meyerozyma guilliermondii ATCC 6260]EDK37079.2 hypothetical protein PGUG_01177 [Meyerozyma guilliermondii ATCC 6260]